MYIVGYTCTCTYIYRWIYIYILYICIIYKPVMKWTCLVSPFIPVLYRRALQRRKIKNPDNLHDIAELVWNDGNQKSLPLYKLGKSKALRRLKISEFFPYIVCLNSKQAKNPILQAIG